MQSPSCHMSWLCNWTTTRCCHAMWGSGFGKVSTVKKLHQMRLEAHGPMLKSSPVWIQKVQQLWSRRIESSVHVSLSSESKIHFKVDVFSWSLVFVLVTRKANRSKRPCSKIRHHSLIRHQNMHISTVPPWKSDRQVYVQAVRIAYSKVISTYFDLTFSWKFMFHVSSVYLLANIFFANSPRWMDRWRFLLDPWWPRLQGRSLWLCVRTDLRHPLEV